MAKDPKKDGRALQYERVPVADLPQGRRGKHHSLVKSILQELEGLPSNSAMKIPLAKVGGVTLANLRSAVHRATATTDLQIETSSDEEHFYIWKSGH